MPSERRRHQPSKPSVIGWIGIQQMLVHRGGERGRDRIAVRPCALATLDDVGMR
jgi:hypothetical protein